MASLDKTDIEKNTTLAKSTLDLKRFIPIVDIKCNVLVANQEKPSKTSQTLIIITTVESRFLELPEPNVVSLRFLHIVEHDPRFLETIFFSHSTVPDHVSASNAVNQTVLGSEINKTNLSLSSCFQWMLVLRIRTRRNLAKLQLCYVNLEA